MTEHGRAAEVDEADEGFIDGPLQRARGWLFAPASLLSVWLTRRFAPVAGGDAFMEIGVFDGRYLALLAYAASAPTRKVVGVDTFQWIDEDEVRASLARVFDGQAPAIDLWRANSKDLDAAALRARVGGAAIRFMSIDGDHAAGPVRRDLELADDVLAEDGVIAADDFLNPLAIGVTDGVCAFFGPRGLFQKKRNLVPFAYGGNKLFLCRPSRYAEYTESTIDFVASARGLASMADTDAQWSRGEPYYKQTLFGGPCLIMSSGMYAG